MRVSQLIALVPAILVLAAGATGDAARRTPRRATPVSAAEEWPPFGDKHIANFQGTIRAGTPFKQTFGYSEGEPVHVSVSFNPSHSLGPQHIPYNWVYLEIQHGKTRQFTSRSDYFNSEYRLEWKQGALHLHGPALNDRGQRIFDISVPLAEE